MYSNTNAQINNKHKQYNRLGIHVYSGLFGFYVVCFCYVNFCRSNLKIISC